MILERRQVVAGGTLDDALRATARLVVELTAGADRRRRRLRQAGCEVTPDGPRD